MAPERKRSARDYEQALAAAKRVLTQALFELRRLGRDLDEQIDGLRSRQPGPARSSQGIPGRPAPPRGAGPGELDRFEAVRNAVDPANRP